MRQKTGLVSFEEKRKKKKKRKPTLTWSLHTRAHTCLHGHLPRGSPELQGSPGIPSPPPPSVGSCVLQAGHLTEGKQTQTKKPNKRRWYRGLPCTAPDICQRRVVSAVRPSALPKEDGGSHLSPDPSQGLGKSPTDAHPPTMRGRDAVKGAPAAGPPPLLPSPLPSKHFLLGGDAGV